MTTEHALCVVCAWRENCQKKFMRGKDASMRCPDFSRDLSIKSTEKLDGKAKDSGNIKEGR